MKTYEIKIKGSCSMLHHGSQAIRMEDPEYKQKKKDIIKKNQELNKDKIREYKRSYMRQYRAKKKIEQELSSSSKLANILRLSEKPYFYATPKSIYYVPDKKTAENLEVKKVIFGEPEGATLKFYINIGVIGSEDSARIELHVRYANGMFESNPTVRVQDLKDPHFIEWEKLN